MQLLDALRLRRRDKRDRTRHSLYISAPHVSERESSLYRPAPYDASPSQSASPAVKAARRRSAWEFWRPENRHGDCAALSSSPAAHGLAADVDDDDDDDLDFGRDGLDAYLHPRPRSYNPRASHYNLARLSRELDATFANFSAVDLTSRRQSMFEPDAAARRKLTSPSMGYLADSPPMTPPVPPPRSHLRAAPPPARPAGPQHSPTPSYASSLASFGSSAPSAATPSPASSRGPFGRARQASASRAAASSSRDPLRVVGGASAKVSSSGVYTPRTFPGPLGVPPLMAARSRSVSSDSSSTSSLPQTPATADAPHGFAPFGAPSPGASASSASSRASLSIKDRTLASFRRISESLGPHAYTPKDVTPVPPLPPLPTYVKASHAAGSPLSLGSAFGSPYPDHAAFLPYEGTLASPRIPRSPRSPRAADASPRSDYSGASAYCVSPPALYEPFPADLAHAHDGRRQASTSTVGSVEFRGRAGSNADERRARRKPVPKIDEARAIEA